MRGELAGLEHEGVAGGEAGGDLPGDLEERVVPRGDQAADADRLVHDAADDVGVAGVDDAPGLLGGDPSVVAEDRDDVVDVVLALDAALAGVERLHPGDRPSVSRSSRSATRRSRSPRSRLRGAGPGPLVERAVRRGDGRVGVLGVRLVDLGHERCRRRGSGSRGVRPRARSSTSRPRRAQARPPPSGGSVAAKPTRSAHQTVGGSVTRGRHAQPMDPVLRMSQPDAPSATSQTLRGCCEDTVPSRAIGPAPRHGDLPVTPAEPVRDLDGGLGHERARPPRGARAAAGTTARRRSSRPPRRRARCGRVRPPR